MLDVGSSELLLIVIVAVVVIGPKDLPRALYRVGRMVGRARGMTRHFRAGIDEMIRQAEMEEMEKKWAADNAHIMARGDAETSSIAEREKNGSNNIVSDDAAGVSLIDATASKDGVEKRSQGPGA